MCRTAAPSSTVRRVRQISGIAIESMKQQLCFGITQFLQLGSTKLAAALPVGTSTKLEAILKSHGGCLQKTLTISEAQISNFSVRLGPEFSIKRHITFAIRRARRL